MKWWVDGLAGRKYNGRTWSSMSNEHLRQIANAIKKKCRKRSDQFLRTGPFEDSWRVDQDNFRDEILADEMLHFANWRERKK